MRGERIGEDRLPIARLARAKSRGCTRVELDTIGIRKVGPWHDSYRLVQNGDFTIIDLTYGYCSLVVVDPVALGRW